GCSMPIWSGVFAWFGAEHNGYVFVLSIPPISGNPATSDCVRLIDQLGSLADLRTSIRPIGGNISPAVVGTTLISSVQLSIEELRSNKDSLGKRWTCSCCVSCKSMSP